MKILGPYKRPDGRKHMVITNEDGSKTTKSYPKFLMEQHVGRELLPNETIDHIDRDFTNDSLDNLRIIGRSEHTKDDIKRVKLKEIICVRCGQTAMKRASYLHGNAKQKKAGPFCGRSCAGKYGKDVQMNKIKLLSAQPKCPKKERIYFYNEKAGVAKLAETQGI